MTQHDPVPATPTTLDWLDGGEYRRVVEVRSGAAGDRAAAAGSWAGEPTAELPALELSGGEGDDGMSAGANASAGPLGAGEELALSGPSSLDLYRMADESRHESGAVRWVRTRGGNLAHAVAASWPAGREGVARCGLFVGAYENRDSVAAVGLVECPTCLELIWRGEDLPAVNGRREA